MGGPLGDAQPNVIKLIAYFEHDKKLHMFMELYGTGPSWVGGCGVAPAHAATSLGGLSGYGTPARTAVTCSRT